MRVVGTLGILLLMTSWSGCGTTKWSDTSRTATEQLLITDSIERAVSRLDFRALAGKKVYVDDGPLKQVTDNAYLTSAIRQHVLACGATLKEKKDEAEYVLEIRGAVGTDRNDLLFGIPATNLPTVTGATYPSSIPEIAFAKKTDQRAVAKISLFAYNRETGRPVWQSGAAPVESKTKALWVLGAGPFRRGSIHDGTTFAGDRLRIPLIDPMLAGDGTQKPVSVADEAFFVEPKEVAKETKPAAPGKAQAAVAPAAVSPPGGQPAAAADPKATHAADAKPAAGQAGSAVGKAGFTQPQAGGERPDSQIQRIPDVFSNLPPETPSGRFGLSGPWSSSPEAAPAGTESAVPPASTAQPSGDVLFGDTWLERRR